MEKISITIGNKDYIVEVAKTEEEQQKGLSNRESLDSNAGMLFDFSDNVGEKSFYMKDTTIPLDIIFIDEDQDVISVQKGEPNNQELITEDNVAYVVELNQDSGIKPGDSLEFQDKVPAMKVLFQDGTSQMDLWGGERIFSRKNTKILIKKAKKADITKDEKDYRSLGRYMFKCIKIQNERKPEYVESPESNK